MDGKQFLWFYEMLEEMVRCDVITFFLRTKEQYKWVERNCSTGFWRWAIKGMVLIILRFSKTYFYYKQYPRKPFKRVVEIGFFWICLKQQYSDANILLDSLP